MLGLIEKIDELTQATGELFAGPDSSVPTSERAPEDSTTAPPESNAFGQTLGDFGRGLAQEGLSGLIDPAGMLDRQAAQRELQSRFDVRNPEDLESPGSSDYAGNQVTPEQYQEIARTYSDIRMGRTNIEFDTSDLTATEAENFRDGSMEDMADILQTKSGRQLINDVAYAERRDGSFGTNRDLTLRRATNVEDAGVSATDPTKTDDRGNGVGADSTLEYVPRQDLAVPGTKDPWWPARSDTVLYHELVHARHNMYGTRASGTVDPTKVPAVDVGVNNAEYQAMGLGDHSGDPMTENRYRAERREIAGKFGERTGDGGPHMVHANNYNPAF